MICLPIFGLLFSQCVTNVFENCDFTFNLTSTSFAYRCANKNFGDHCKLPDDVVQPNFVAVTEMKITNCPLNVVQKSYRKYKNLKSLDLNSGYNSLKSIQLKSDHLTKLNFNNLTDISAYFFK